MGSHKPWLTSGLFQKDSNYYHHNFKLITGKNFHKWQKNNYQERLIKKLNDLKNNIVQWDQDVLNIFFDSQ